jgi:hypothetical protein
MMWACCVLLAETADVEADVGGAAQFQRQGRAVYSVHGVQLMRP